MLQGHFQYASQAPKLCSSLLLNLNAKHPEKSLGPNFAVLAPTQKHRFNPPIFPLQVQNMLLLQARRITVLLD